MYGACSMDDRACQQVQASPGGVGLAQGCTQTAGAHGGLQGAMAMHLWFPRHESRHQLHLPWRLGTDGVQHAAHWMPPEGCWE